MSAYPIHTYFEKGLIYPIYRLTCGCGMYEFGSPHCLVNAMISSYSNVGEATSVYAYNPADHWCQCHRCTHPEKYTDVDDNNDINSLNALDELKQVDGTQYLNGRSRKLSTIIEEADDVEEVYYYSPASNSSDNSSVCAFDFIRDETSPEVEWIDDDVKLVQAPEELNDRFNRVLDFDSSFLSAESSVYPVYAYAP
uniref:Headcase middle domain-containing protein n=1 Tax=Panagrellus redivivus TaxID=6233 RepID=A0A7E4ZVB3_PANRE